jgi:hypothetical protein
MAFFVFLEIRFDHLPSSSQLLLFTLLLILSLHLFCLTSLTLELVEELTVILCSKGSLFLQFLYHSFVLFFAQNYLAVCYLLLAAGLG